MNHPKESASQQAEKPTEKTSEGKFFPRVWLENYRLKEIPIQLDLGDKTLSYLYLHPHRETAEDLTQYLSLEEHDAITAELRAKLVELSAGVTYEGRKYSEELQAKLAESERAHEVCKHANLAWLQEIQALKAKLATAVEALEKTANKLTVQSCGCRRELRKELNGILAQLQDKPKEEE